MPRAAQPAADAEAPIPDTEPTTVAEQQAWVLQLLETRLGVTEPALSRVRAILQASPYLGTGNPKISERALSRAECRQRRATAQVRSGDAVCGSPNMVALYDPGRGQTGEQATVCIDQFEFPNVACEYPVVHVSARDAASICEAMGKRLCDAHEWEGACAGSLLPPEAEYPWGKDRINMEYYHNKDREIVWAYGTTNDDARCGTGSFKHVACQGGGFPVCGTNTYPTGSFPECVSRFGVYDQHGNVAEHMSLPMKPEQLGSRGGHGDTEMKGSWFIFGRYRAHEDDCRWRAPKWHNTRVLDVNSHSNYHLGFRCCKDLGSSPR